MLKSRVAACALYAGVFMAACQAQTEIRSADPNVSPQALPGRAPTPVNQSSVLAGTQYTDDSAAGKAKGPDGDYWSKASRSMATRLSATPSVLWTVATLAAPDHAHLTFARPSSASAVDPHIEFADADANGAALKAFDQQGVRVWLMIEPGLAPVQQLIELILTQYGSHPSIAGVGIDAGWLGVSVDTRGTVIQGDSGTPVTDAAAQGWLELLHRHDPGLRLLLAHWQAGNLPPTLRQGLMFLDNGRGYASLDAQVGDYAAFARKLAPAPVGFLLGDSADAPWWCHLADPPHELGNAVLSAVPDAQGLFWSDTTADQVFLDLTYSCPDAAAP